MSLTDLAYILGTGCVTVAMLILLLGFLTRKPTLKEKPPLGEKDFWPEYSPTRERKTK